MANMITIGRIGRHHNLKGEVKCIILSDFPERFLELDRVFLEKDEDIKRVHVEHVKFQKNYAIIKFKEFNSISEVEKLSGYLLKIPEDEAIELPEGHYFIHDLLGMEVFTVKDEFLGILEDVVTTGSNDIYVVRNGSKEILIPAVYEIVQNIDPENKKITVRLIEGLTD